MAMTKGAIAGNSRQITTMEGKNYIAGRWKGATTEQTFERHNPAQTDMLLGVFPRSNHKDIDAAVQAQGLSFIRVSPPF